MNGTSWAGIVGEADCSVDVEADCAQRKATDTDIIASQLPPLFLIPGDVNVCVRNSKSFSFAGIIFIEKASNVHLHDDAGDI